MMRFLLPILWYVKLPEPFAVPAPGSSLALLEHVSRCGRRHFWISYAMDRFVARSRENAGREDDD